MKEHSLDESRLEWSTNGNARVECGVSINKEISSSKFNERSIVAQRIDIN